MILNGYTTSLLSPCNYSFPVSSTEQFSEVANTISSTGVSAMIGISQSLAFTDPSLTQLISPLLSAKTRHNAVLRSLLDEVPDPAPFDTGISSIWAYNIALSFTVPGSCPVELPIPVIPGLTVTQVSNANSTVAPYANSTIGANGNMMREFTWDPRQVHSVAEGNKQLLAGWVNQANKPVYTPLMKTGSGKGRAR